jgi:hypothetical protein
VADETVIRNILLESAAIVALVDNRIYFNKAPQAPQAPYMVYSLISGAPETYLADSAGLTRKVVQLSCYASTASLGRQMSDLCFRQIESKHHKCISEVFVGFEEDTELYHFASDYSLWLEI